MKQRRRWWKYLVPLLVGGWAIFIMFRWYEHSQVFHPDRVLWAKAADLGRPCEDVFFSASDGVKLNGWFFPADKQSPRAPLAFLVCHGNGGNISHRLDLCQALLETGVSVFVFDYRGYGRSEGRPGEEGTYCDAQGAYEWLQRKGFATSNIVAYGESLGGGVACELAARKTVGGLVLQSTFTCIPDVGAELFPWLPVRWLGSIQYDTCRKLPRLRVPVLVMHSRDDRLIPFRHAERNFAAANEPKLLWEISGGHNDALAERAGFIAGIQAFLSLLEKQPVRSH